MATAQRAKPDVRKFPAADDRNAVSIVILVRTVSSQMKTHVIGSTDWITFGDSAPATGIEIAQGYGIERSRSY